MENSTSHSKPNGKNHNTKLNKPILFMPSFDQLVAEYRNETEANDSIHRELTKATWENNLLAKHRKYIEENNLGFGDAAFHSMWAGIMEAAVYRHKKVRALEIGVFKGQVISLWALLAKNYKWPIKIAAISPLKGAPRPKNKILQKAMSVFSKKYRERIQNGDFYEDEKYEKIIQELFKKFKIEYSDIHMLKGFSTDQKVINEAKNLQFEILYVDGDHTFEGARHDFQVFGEKVVKGGWLIADDAGCALPGTRFWKGHEAVSRAVEILPSLGFKNVLNVGHNRVFEKVSAI